MNTGEVLVRITSETAIPDRPELESDPSTQEALYTYVASDIP